MHDRRAEERLCLRQRAAAPLPPTSAATDRADAGITNVHLLRRSSRAAAIERRGVVVRRGLGVEARSTTSLDLAGGRADLSAEVASRAARAAAPPCRIGLVVHVSLVRGRRLLPARTARPPPHRDQSGGRRRPGTRRRSMLSRFPWGNSDRAPGPRPARERRPVRLGPSKPGRSSHPGWSLSVPAARADRRRVGVDVQRLRRLSGLPPPIPYKEYLRASSSARDEHGRVLRRAAHWATRARVVTPTFRNWDYPQRRQIFAGLRIARDL